MTAKRAARMESHAACAFATAMDHSSCRGSPRFALKQEDAQRGLAQLVLTVIELLRELLERQALRRMDAGSLTEEQTERLGTTFLQVAAQMERLKREFGLETDDLNIDLGPLGRLL